MDSTIPEANFARKLSVYNCITTCSSFVLACLLAIALQVISFSPISPLPLQIPSSSLPPNNRLQSVMKLGEGILKQPEDVGMDEMGMLYTATRDGWIKRMHTNGTWENWKLLHTDTLLGLTITRAGDLIVCDSQEVLASGRGYNLFTVKDTFLQPLLDYIGDDELDTFSDQFHGLLKVCEDGATVLASHVNGAKIRFADDVVEALDGSLYFSVASTKFGLHDWYLDVLEAKPHGQLLKYDPLTKETSIVLDGLCFANGVAVSSDGDYLVVCESWKHRCLKYWLKEEIKGKVEIFVDNLPGAPDNIKLAPDGSFWIALLQLTSRGMEFVHTSKALKHLLATVPRLIEQVKGFYKSAMVVNVGKDGKIVKMFDDSNGKVMSFTTSVLEFEGHLYLGSLKKDFIGKLPLETV